MSTAIAPDRDSLRAFGRCQSGKAAAEGIGVFGMERLPDDPPHVIFAQDGSIERMGHEEGEHSNIGISSSVIAS
jgi:hypothetical protein